MNGRLFERWIWGLLIIGIGVTFLLKQLGVIDFEINIGQLFVTFWPLFLIIPGLRGLLFQRRYSSGQSIGSLFMVGIGFVFLSQNLDWFAFSWGTLFSFIFPVGIILFGLSFLFRSKKYDNHDSKNDDKYYRKYEKYKKKYEDKYDHSYGPDYNKTYDSHEPHDYKSDLGDLDDLDREFKDEFGNSKKPGFKFEATFGSSSDDKYRQPNDSYHYVNTDSPNNHRPINKSGFIGDVHFGREGYWDLKPLNVSHFIGDTIIDLTKANIPYGETKINVSSFIGDVKIFVPHDVDVEVNVTAATFIGDQRIFDRRAEGLFGNTKYVSDYYSEAPRKLRINVSMFIGDTIVKKVG
ncbi:hypothetical protein E0485_09680 [Paenibacillus albiflavus]|uniref:Cell wall-active antibiotics response protein n=1 Tax=Paenibacillus albiflavus TaxID=2545760 RepID=A0A4R4EF77_9BACL|nr:cell wall-active antibiotics response protein LiaF [Paenibacillus albiflavus]TCZ77740.1 hypothetical protein E0485_09680 [Paenibacillus albiflavus]